MNGTGSTKSRLSRLWRGFFGNDRIVLLLLALVVGIAGGLAVIAFREGIAMAQTVFYGSETQHLYTYVTGLSPWHRLLAPTAGGLLIGLLTYNFLPGRRPQDPSDVIEACTFHGGRMGIVTGLRTAVVSAVSIGAGASVGREGPAVHLGASIGGWLAARLGLERSASRTLLGCGVASAVAASFNAPIAGALFATEVVVGHNALRAFAPIVIASVAATTISRAYFGDFPAFAIPEQAIKSSWEYMAFVGLGLLCGVVAKLFIRAIPLAASIAGKMVLAPWLRAAVGGLLIGIIALAVPQVMGVGYGTTESAITGNFSLTLLIVLAVAKIIATAISLGFGFGGGVFSPSLVIGAMVGGAYGDVFSNLFPYISSGALNYTIVGMGAVAASVLGAPISTILIIFELTSNYPLTIGVMVAVVVAAVTTEQMHGRSFFTEQLERRGVDVRGSLAAGFLHTTKVGDIVVSSTAETIAPGGDHREIMDSLRRSGNKPIFIVNDEGVLVGDISLSDLSGERSSAPAADLARTDSAVLTATDSIKAALDLFGKVDKCHIAVVEDRESMIFLGTVSERDVLEAYNNALIESRREERGH